MFAIYMSANFPLEDYGLLADILTSSQVLVPAFIPPKVGLLSLDAVIYASRIDEMETILVPDRNIVSRIVKVARDRAVGKRDLPTQVALATMAIAQTVDFAIEPSIAFHEYAHKQGNLAANDELSLFRVADHANAVQWIDIALGRRSSFVPPIPQPIADPIDLAFPLHRWRRNYVAMLKVGELLLHNDLAPVERMGVLLDWMERDFLIASPAAVFAAYLFAPVPKLGRAMKGLKAANRERAIDGIKNAAWDVTHVSELVRQANEGKKDGKRYVFVTADRVLHLVAEMVIRLSVNISADEGVEAPLMAWWPRRQAKIIGDLLTEKVALASEVRPECRVSFSADQLEEMTASGETRIREGEPFPQCTNFSASTGRA